MYLGMSIDKKPAITAAQ